MKRYVLPLLIVLLPVAIYALWEWTPRTVPPERACELYRQYASNPHLTVSYIEDFRVNDTVTVDVTLLEAKDDEGWEEMMEKFGIIDLSDIPDEVRHLFAEKTKAIGFGHYEEDDEGEIVNIVVYSRIEKSVYLFHTKKDAEIKAIFTEKITETTQ